MSLPVICIGQIVILLILKVNIFLYSGIIDTDVLTDKITENPEAGLESFRI